MQDKCCRHPGPGTFCKWDVSCSNLCSYVCVVYTPLTPQSMVWVSVVSVVNVLFKLTNLLSERSEQNHFVNWFVPFSVQLSSAASVPVRSGTAVTHTENCEEVIHVRAVLRSWCDNLLHTENCRWGRNSRSGTVLKVALCHSLTHPGQRSWFTFSNCTA